MREREKSEVDLELDFLAILNSNSCCCKLGRTKGLGEGEEGT
jgi:hypothetical protein